MPWKQNPLAQIRKVNQLVQVIEQNLPGAAMAGAGELINPIRSRAPRLTGRLAFTLRTQAGDSNSQMGVAEGVTDGFYWRYYEYGTRRQTKRPFVRPAVDNNSGEVGRAVAKHITRQTRRIT